MNDPKQFKKVIHATFPEVYDTKHMAYCSRRQLEASNSLDFADNLRNTSLNQLYLKILKSKPNRGAFMYTPLVKHSEMTPKYSKENGDFCHEAGFDAVMSGAIFIRIAHLMAGVEYL